MENNFIIERNECQKCHNFDKMRQRVDPPKLGLLVKETSSRFSPEILNYCIKNDLIGAS